MQIRTILLCVVLGLVAVASARRPNVAWDRSSDPFMRMASKIADPSMIEAGTVRSLVQAATAQVKTGSAPAPAAAAPAASPAPAAPAASPVMPGAVVPDATKVSEPPILPRPANPPTDPSKGGAGASGTSVSAANAVLGMVGQAQTSSGSAADSLNRIMAPTSGPGTQCVGMCQNSTDSAQKDDGGGAFLVAVKKYDNDCSKLGCTSKLSLDSKEFKKAKKVMQKADGKHEEFQDNHWKTCMGKICEE